MSAALAEKSPEAFRTISEVATELDVPQHVLRFWETRFAQIRPVKRAGGRRYYRPEDVDLLRGIRALLYSDGYTIKGVQKILREQGVRYVAEVGRQPPRTRARRSDPAQEAVPAPAVPMVEGATHAGNRAAQSDVPLKSVAHPVSDHATRRQLKDLLQELHRMKRQLRAARERVRT